MLQIISRTFSNCRNTQFSRIIAGNLIKRSHSTDKDAREKARQKIAEIEANTKITPNSPMGLMDRSPGTDVNSVPTYFDEYLTDGERARFEPFPGGKNPETGEIRGPTGPEPTRFGDWERKGRCSDF